MILLHKSYTAKDLANLVCDLQDGRQHDDTEELFAVQMQTYIEYLRGGRNLPTATSISTWLLLFQSFQPLKIHEIAI